MSFTANTQSLSDVLEAIGTGKIALPDFQREWKWDDERIRSLLATVSQGHPLGVIMVLAVEGQPMFAPTPLSGVTGSIQPAQFLLLDGQQRMTSLYRSLKSDAPVDTTDAKGSKKLRRWYFIDVAKAVDLKLDREESILAVREDFTVRKNFDRDIVADYSTIEAQTADGVMPVSYLIDAERRFDWESKYFDHEDASERRAIWKSFLPIIKNFVQYQIPVITLTADTPSSAVCNVFERVNTGGVPLNVFELVTASFAAEDRSFKLAADWKVRHQRIAKQSPLAEGVKNTDFLQAASLLRTLKRLDEYRATSGDPAHEPAVSAKRNDTLGMTLGDYQSSADELEKAFVWAGTFLDRQGVRALRELPYQSQLVPLAVIRARIGLPTVDQQATFERISQWYWCGVLGELYGSASETRFARDVVEVPAWAVGKSGTVPQTIDEATFRFDRLDTLRRRNSAAYKGIACLLSNCGLHDWAQAYAIETNKYATLKIDIHHIFPQAWCEKQGIPVARYDSIVNKTPLSASTNQSIGGRSPAKYWEALERKRGITTSALAAIVEKHLIDVDLLQAADFNKFYEDRKERLATLIELAMGKPVFRPDKTAAPIQFDDDEQVDDDHPSDDDDLVDGDSTEERKAFTVNRLIEKGALVDGAAVRFTLPYSGGKDFQDVQAWIDQQPERGQASWQNNPNAPLIWSADGLGYRPTPLVQHIFELAGKDKQSVQGPNWWTIEDGRRLPEVADDLDGFDDLPS